VDGQVGQGVAEGQRVPPRLHQRRQRVRGALGAPARADLG